VLSLLYFRENSGFLALFLKPFKGAFERLSVSYDNYWHSFSLPPYCHERINCKLSYLLKPEIEPEVNTFIPLCLFGYPNIALSDKKEFGL
jgi:hypothetical protein